ncbi:MAG: ribonuclease D [Pseudomonadota bacterium]
MKTQKELEQACKTLSTKDFITVDTEFLRDRTYFSKLCLIQLGADDFEAVAIDPLEQSIDLSPFYKLMQNKKVLKVFHAARQDLEIFFHETGKLPTPLFDTQVAAMVCGYGDSIAYARLVQDITGHTIPKNAQFTDWSKRPLSQKQIDYAIGDVTHLVDVYKDLSKRLKKQKRQKWVDEEMEILTSKDTYKIEPNEIWKRVKIRSDKPRTLAILRALAAWREDEAVEKNVPRSHIVKDDILANIAIYEPKSKGALSHIRGIPPSISKGKYTKSILEIVSKTLETKKSSWPQAKNREPFPKECGPALEMLKLLLKIKSSENDVASKLIANQQDLEAIILKERDVAALKGWRKDVFGKDALALLKGSISLGIQDSKIKIIKV